MDFANSREWYDRDHRVAFDGHDGGKQVIFYVSIQVLEKEFGLTSTKPDDALAVFRRNRAAIERVAEVEYARGNIILNTAAFKRGGGGMTID